MHMNVIKYSGLQSQDKMEWMTKQISPKVSCVIMFTYFEPSVCSISTSAALANSLHWNLYFFSYALSRLFSQIPWWFFKKLDHVTPAYVKPIKIPIAFLNKIQIPLRSHFLSCLSQSVFSNVPDQLSIPIKILSSGPLHFLAPLPGVHFSPTLNFKFKFKISPKFPSINQDSLLSRRLITSSL